MVSSMRSLVVGCGGSMGSRSQAVSSVKGNAAAKAPTKLRDVTRYELVRCMKSSRSFPNKCVGNQNRQSGCPRQAMGAADWHAPCRLCDASHAQSRFIQTSYKETIHALTSPMQPRRIWPVIMVSVVKRSACGEADRLEVETDYCIAPELPRPVKTLIPTVKSAMTQPWAEAAGVPHPRRMHTRQAGTRPAEPARKRCRAPLSSSCGRRAARELAHAAAPQPAMHATASSSSAR